ncbi:sensor histidine kinase [Mediterraneibacter agrestimuris]|uniref:sensor histidine kinase n=1 Tax=Mediterraneibacter agrestimuris TaxID=2941333 RepID=UPI0020426883|nr:ATP-binding protein [Mediterraneibacter agrestimuris]
MTKRIFRSICLVALTVFLASVVLFMGVLYEYFSNVEQAQLKMQTTLAAQGVTNEGIDYFHDLKVKNYRISWIDTEGNVIFDSASDIAEMENHLERKEVQEALSSGYGESRRYSATLMERSFYSAQKLDDGTILRLSISQNSILTLLLGMTQPICIIFVIALILSIVLAIQVSKKIVKPLNEIDLDNPLSNEGYDELSPFLRRIDSQQKQLRGQKTELLQKENELNTIIGSMNEGMILLNQKGKIISINPAAKKLLSADTDCIGSDMLSLCRNLELQEILTKALHGERGENIIRLYGESYQIDADPITSENIVKGAALFFFNVTEKEKAEQIRREFTANVSHELKTPLHSISGYAELLKNDMVKENDKIPFAGKIYDEAGRMIQLVEDIISLSHLDEGADDMQRENIDLYTLAEKAVQSLEPQADTLCVTLELSGVSAPLNGIPQLLYSVIYNLCDNAIKYNHENGKVMVDIQSKNGVIVLSVKDTGIGIAPEHQERIFERFYRVDKSHSKAVGGTGLGLSIVKHAAKIHNAKVDVKSHVGKGSTVIVTFPK